MAESIHGHELKVEAAFSSIESLEAVVKKLNSKSGGGDVTITAEAKETPIISHQDVEPSSGYESLRIEMERGFVYRDERAESEKSEMVAMFGQFSVRIEALEASTENKLEELESEQQRIAHRNQLKMDTILKEVRRAMSDLDDTHISRVREIGDRLEVDENAKAESIASMDVRLSTSIVAMQSHIDALTSQKTTEMAAMFEQQAILTRFINVSRSELEEEIQAAFKLASSEASSSIRESEERSITATEAVAGRLVARGREHEREKSRLKTLESEFLVLQKTTKSELDSRLAFEGGDRNKLEEQLSKRLTKIEIREEERRKLLEEEEKSNKNLLDEAVRRSTAVVDTALIEVMASMGELKELQVTAMTAVGDRLEAEEKAKAESEQAMSDMSASMDARLSTSIVFMQSCIEELKLSEAELSKRIQRLTLTLIITLTSIGG